MSAGSPPQRTLSRRGSTVGIVRLMPLDGSSPHHGARHTPPAGATRSVSIAGGTKRHQQHDPAAKRRLGAGNGKQGFSAVEERLLRQVYSERASGLDGLYALRECLIECAIHVAPAALADAVRALPPGPAEVRFATDTTFQQPISEAAFLHLVPTLCVSRRDAPDDDTEERELLEEALAELNEEVLHEQHAQAERAAAERERLGQPPLNIPGRGGGGAGGLSPTSPNFNAPADSADSPRERITVANLHRLLSQFDLDDEEVLQETPRSSGLADSVLAAGAMKIRPGDSLPTAMSQSTGVGRPEPSVDIAAVIDVLCPKRVVELRAAEAKSRELATKQAEERAEAAARAAVSVHFTYEQHEKEQRHKLNAKASLARLAGGAPSAGGDGTRGASSGAGGAPSSGPPRMQVSKKKSMFRSFANTAGRSDSHAALGGPSASRYGSVASLGLGTSTSDTVDGGAPDGGDGGAASRPGSRQPGSLTPGLFNLSEGIATYVESSPQNFDDDSPRHDRRANTERVGGGAFRPPALGHIRGLRGAPKERSPRPWQVSKAALASYRAATTQRRRLRGVRTPPPPQPRCHRRCPPAQA